MTLFRRNNDVIIALCVRWDRTTLPLRPRLHYIKHSVHWLYCSGCWFHLGSAYLHIHIGTVFKRSQLSFDIYKVSNHHFIHDIHQMTSGLPNLYKFQWAITSSLSYVEYWPENNKTVLAALWWLMWHSNTLQLPSESCSSSPCVMIMSHCSEGGFH